MSLAPGIAALFVPEASPMNHDAGLVLVVDGHSLVNLNDARLFPVQLRRIREELGGTVDVLTSQGAGASWFPSCYHYGLERTAELRESKRSAKLAYLASTVEVLEPKATLPFAGPPCFLDDEMFAFNAEMDGGVFPTQHDVAAWLSAERGIESVVLLPGEHWDTDARTATRLSEWEGFYGSDCDAYLRSYALKRRPDLVAVYERYPEPTESLDARVRCYFERLLGMSSYFNEQIGMRVGFDITGRNGGQWTVDFRPGNEGVSAGLNNCQYIGTPSTRVG